MKPVKADEVEKHEYTEDHKAVLFANELTVLCTLLAILFAVSLAYIVVRALINSRRSGFLSSGSKSETLPIKCKGYVNAA